MKEETNIFKGVIIISLFDGVFNDKQVKQKHSVTSTLINTTTNIIKSTGLTTYNTAKNLYLMNIDWCNSFYNTDIYYKCTDTILKQLYGLIDFKFSEVPDKIGIDFADTYWFNDDIQKKYTKQQLKRIEKEMEYKSSSDLCYEMVYFIWHKIIPKNRFEDIMTEIEVFKICNKVRCKK